MSDDPFPMLAVEIGNSRVKIGRFDEPPAETGLPRPVRTLTLESAEWDPVEIALWLAPAKPHEFPWLVGSVRRDSFERLAGWLMAEGASVTRLTHEDLPLFVGLPAPEQVGIDRLVGAVAANRIRAEGQPAIVVDLGSAITVDVISSDGTFCGGSILPGIAMSARALGEFTDQLPTLSQFDLKKPPPAIGTSTHEAITSGLYWGAVGAIRVLVRQLREQMTTEPLIILTGGGAPYVAGALETEVRHEPDLLLAGIALSVNDQ